VRPPEFWNKRGATSTLLLPVGWIYAAATARRVRRTGRRAPVPVISVGNLGVGGAGKTPVALALARRLLAAGRAPHFLTRGYGGREAGPLRVDPARHDYRAVGDEALLLARAAPTWVSHRRAAGAEAAVAAGAGVLVMDDAHQNPDVAKDLSLVVIDGGYGFGNRRVIPAGPLREPVAAGLARADAAILVGDDAVGARAHIGALTVLEARLVPDEAAVAALAGKRVVAFCGIGRPDKFFDTVKAMGAALVEAMPFPDHHAFTPDDVMLAVELAAREGAVPVTTEKDFVRLPSEARPMVTPVPVRLEFADEAAAAALLAGLWKGEKRT
jgi:tetraacyldisaccharide 4'-kinase